MKMLLACAQYNYGDPGRGHSYEYVQFFQTLQQMGIDVRLFDTLGEEKQHGRAAMNARLQAASHDQDLVMVSLCNDELLPETLARIRSKCKTFGFFHDDTWRVEYSRYWARHFDFFSTPDFHGVRKYQRLGLPNAIYLPFGCNEKVYPPAAPEVKQDIEVSFVGAWHPYREWLLRRLRRRGLDVKAYGYRWPEGQIDHQQMVSIFQRSQISLNLSNSASWDLRYLFGHRRALINRLRSPKTGEQIKGRHFEVNACKGFQLSFYTDGLEHCFLLGEEIGIYLDADDLVSKTIYYLEDPELRAQIAKAGHQRVLRDHTYSGRFYAAFARMGFQIPQRVG